MPSSEASICYDDSTIGVDWPISPEKMLLSSKDLNGVSFNDAEKFD